MTESTPVTSIVRFCTLCGNPSKFSCCKCGTDYCSRECQIADWRVGHKTTCLKMPQCLQNINFIFAGKNLEETPLAKQAVKTVSNHKFNPEAYRIYVHNVPTTLKEYLHILQDLHGGVFEIDCALFVQLVLASHNLLGYDAKTCNLDRIAFCVGSTISAGITYASSLAAKTGSFELGPCYYRINNTETYKALCNANLNNKGQWLLGPDKNNTYLGMADRPLRMKLPKWHERIMHNLNQELQEETPDSSDYKFTMESISRNLIKCQIDLGEFTFDNYSIIRYSNTKD